VYIRHLVLSLNIEWICEVYFTYGAKLHVPADLSPKKRPRYSLDMMLAVRQGLCGYSGENVK
jgi:hypothetical protein